MHVYGDLRSYMLRIATSMCVTASRPMWFSDVAPVYTPKSFVCKRCLSHVVRIGNLPLPNSSFDRSMLEATLPFFSTATEVLLRRRGVP